MPPTITLTTDFGTQDAYVAQMKGVLLSQGPPDLRVVDLSHALSAHAIGEAALFLRAAVPRFPPGTVHVAVIDPGVGSARPALVVRVDGQWLVGPDNGLFTYLLDGQAQVYRIDLGKLGDGPVSHTFHGRDVFAPAAARLARGVEVGTFAHACTDYQRIAAARCRVNETEILGEVVHVDRFGNLITNIDTVSLGALQHRVGEVQVSLAGRELGVLRTHYAEVGRGEPLALVGSDALLEVAVREGSAAEQLGAGVGHQVRVTSLS